MLFNVDDVHCAKFSQFGRIIHDQWKIVKKQAFPPFKRLEIKVFMNGNKVMVPMSLHQIRTGYDVTHIGRDPRLRLGSLSPYA